MKNKKWNDKIVIAIGVLSILVLINIIVSFQNSGIENITGSVIEDSSVNNEEYNKMFDQVSNLRNENERLVLEKNALSEKVSELEAKVKSLEAEKEIKEETCPLTCDVDEICSPVNKKDGSVEWQCVDDPAKFV